MADDKQKEFQDLLNKFADASKKTDESLRTDAYKNPQLFMQQGNCIRCHDKGPGFKNNDFGSLRSFEMKPLDIKGFEAKPLDPAEVERRAVEKFNKQPDMEKAITIMNRLPAKIDISIEKDKASITTDFVKALEAIPGVKLSQEAKDHLSKVKTIGFENGTYTIKLDKAIPFGQPPIGSLGPELSFKVKKDGLTNLKGMTYMMIPIEDLTVNTDGGKNSVKAVGNVFGKKVEHEIDLNKYGVSGDLLKQAIGEFSKYESMFQTRDFSELTKNIPEGFRNTVGELLKGVTAVTKDGDKYTIKRNNGVQSFDLGGPTVSVSPLVSFKLGSDSDAPSIREMSGITFSMPLPEKLEMGSKYVTGIKGVSLGYADRDGGRTVRVDLDNTIDSVKVRVDGNFKPRTDNDGNWNLNIRGNNPLSPDGRKDKMDIDIRIGADGKVNMKTSEILDIVSKLTWQASDASVTGVSMGAAATYSKIASWISSWFE